MAVSSLAQCSQCFSGGVSIEEGLGTPWEHSGGYRVQMQLAPLSAVGKRASARERVGWSQQQHPREQAFFFLVSWSSGHIR